MGVRMKEQTEAEYHAKYNNACNHLLVAAGKLNAGLSHFDVAGALLAVATEFLRHHERDSNVVTWLRDLADGIEKHEVGIKPAKTELN